MLSKDKFATIIGRVSGLKGSYNVEILEDWKRGQASIRLLSDNAASVREGELFLNERFVPERLYYYVDERVTLFRAMPISFTIARGVSFDELYELIAWTSRVCATFEITLTSVTETYRLA